MSLSHMSLSLVREWKLLFYRSVSCATLAWVDELINLQSNPVLTPCAHGVHFAKSSRKTPSRVESSRPFWSIFLAKKKEREEGRREKKKEKKGEKKLFLAPPPTTANCRNHTWHYVTHHPQSLAEPNRRGHRCVHRVMTPSPTVIKGALHARVTRKWEVEMILNLGFWLWVQLELALKIDFCSSMPKILTKKILDPYQKS